MSFKEPFNFAQATKLPVKVILPIIIAAMIVVIIEAEAFASLSIPIFLLN